MLCIWCLLQVVGTECEVDAVYSVSLKRVHYGLGSNEGHLQWQAHKIRTLRAGTMGKLIEHLSPCEDPVDVSYRTCFVSTYRTFTTAVTVLQLLIER